VIDSSGRRLSGKSSRIPWYQVIRERAVRRRARGRRTTSRAGARSAGASGCPRRRPAAVGSNAIDSRFRRSPRRRSRRFRPNTRTNPGPRIASHLRPSTRRSTAWPSRGVKYGRFPATRPPASSHAGRASGGESSSTSEATFPYHALRRIRGGPPAGARPCRRRRRRRAVRQTEIPDFVLTRIAFEGGG